jgi:hypothetical protein
VTTDSDVIVQDVDRKKAIHTKDGADGCFSHRGALNETALSQQRKMDHSHSLSQGNIKKEQKKRANTVEIRAR